MRPSNYLKNCVSLYGYPQYPGVKRVSETELNALGHTARGRDLYTPTLFFSLYFQFKIKKKKLKFKALVPGTQIYS